MTTTDSLSRGGRGARGAVAGAIALLAISIVWIAVRAAVPGDAAPVIADPGFRHGLSVDPLARSNSTLRASDVVVAIDGVPVDSWLRGRAPVVHGSLTYRVRRDGHLVSVPVLLGHDDVSNARFRTDGGVLLCALTILGLGGYTVYRRREASAAHSLLLLGAGLVAYSTFVTFGYDTSDLAGRRALFVAGFLGSELTLLVWTMAASHLALTYPRPVRLVQQHRRGLTLGFAGLVLAIASATTATLLSGSATLYRLNLLNAANSAVLTLLTLLTVAGLGHTLWRTWREPDARPQGLLVVIGFAATVIGLLIANLVAGDQKWPPWLDLVLLLPLPLAVTTAVLRGEFLGIRAVLNRTLVYTVLTGLLLGVYAVAATTVGAVVGSTRIAPTLLATAAVAIAFAPLRSALQRVVDKLLYGARGDRVEVLRTIGQRLEATADPGAVLPTIAETVANSLHLPYVAVRTYTAEGVRLAVERGERTADLHSVPLVHHGAQVGELVVAARRGERSISTTDASILADVARQVAPAVRASRLVTDLAASRSRLAVTREEERAQLRHDLHDRLGPHLVGLSLQLDSLSDRVHPGETSEAVARAHEEATLALDEVRRISRGLRPAELEELGLVQAINAAAARLSIADEDAAWSVSVDAAVQLGTIPPDVEAAAYQIALEGLTNAYRHSGGRTASIRVGVTAAGSALIVEVTDDGTGIEDSAPAGIGIRSMHTRAEAVGGTVAVTSSGPHGTTVRARLPLTRAASN